MKKLFLQYGKLMIGDFPEEPKWHEIPATPSGCDYEIRDEQRDEYNSAVTAAKGCAVEVINSNEIIYTDYKKDQWFRNVVNQEPLKEGQLYDLPQGWTVELSKELAYTPDRVCYNCLNNRHDLCAAPTTCQCDHTDTPWWKSVAHLASVKASGIVATGVPERDTTANDRTEPTVNTIIDRIGELYEGLKDLHHAQEVYDKSGEFFASLQELRNIACVAVKSVSPPPQAESQEQIFIELFNRVLILSEGGYSGTSIAKSLRDSFTITRKAKP